MTTPLVLKLGGELLETPAARARIAACCATQSARQPLVVVHGGGRAVDAELDRRGLAPKKVDGLRITDAATLDVVVCVLAGASNTALVASLVDAGVAAVGLTGVDAGLGQAARSHAHVTASGAVADLGFVGDPTDADPRLLGLLIGAGYVPVVASIGLEREAPRALLNVNADVMACRIAAALGASLVIAGATAGVFDADGRTIPAMTAADIDRLIANGTATAGMIAKLSSCREALQDGVPDVRIIDGRTLDATHGPDSAPGTHLRAARYGGQAQDTPTRYAGKPSVKNPEPQSQEPRA
jgi:acetylglutamate kinase